ncbi:MAG: hypothetical protein RR911_05985 [Oscillospiraceae bacterium]
MKRILRMYAVLTTICLCVITLTVGVLTAESNTRAISFGEEYEVVAIYNTGDEKIGISSGDKSFEVPSEILKKLKEKVKDTVLFLSPVINNLDWLAENITDLLKD